MSSRTGQSLQRRGGLMRLETSLGRLTSPPGRFTAFLYLYFLEGVLKLLLTGINGRFSAYLSTEKHIYWSTNQHIIKRLICHIFDLDYLICDS